MVYLLPSIALSPVLLCQGLNVRRRIPRLPEPPGNRVGSQGKGPQLRLLILGDSAAAGVGASHQDEALLGQIVSRLEPDFRVEWRLLAKTGATTASTLEALRSIEGETFDIVVTSLGVNDVTSGVRRSIWLGQQKRLRHCIRARFGDPSIIVSGLPPVHGFPALPQPLRWALGERSRDFNRALEKEVRDEAGCRFLPLEFLLDASLMASDGFHPGPAVYAAWGEKAAKCARSIVAQQIEAS